MFWTEAHVLSKQYLKLLTWNFTELEGKESLFIEACVGGNMKNFLNSYQWEAVWFLDAC